MHKSRTKKPGRAGTRGETPAHRPAHVRSVSVTQAHVGSEGEGREEGGTGGPGVEPTGPAGSAARSGELYVVGTPIGNLEDVTLRALSVLAGADVILAEDTRVTAKLLDRHRVARKLLTLNEHNEAQMLASVLERLAHGERIALVSDAGTPAISDPGARLVSGVRAAGRRVTPIPGPSALAAALSVAGVGEEPVMFCGFLPSKTEARRARIAELQAIPAALVFFEAPHRVLESVEDLAAIADGARRLVIARELTKLHESVHECALAKAPAWLAGDPNRLRGEFVLVLHAAAMQARKAADWEPVLAALLEELPLAQAVKLACKATGAPRNAVYPRALEMAKEQDP